MIDCPSCHCTFYGYLHMQSHRTLHPDHFYASAKTVKHQGEPEAQIYKPKRRQNNDE